MRYLGIVEKRHDGQIILEGCGEAIKSAGNDGAIFEAFEVESVIVLVPAPVDRLRLSQIEMLTNPLSTTAKLWRALPDELDFIV